MNSLSNEDLVAVEPFARKPIEMTGARPMSREPYSYPAFPIETSYGRKKIFAYKPAETVETDIALEPAMFSENGMGFLGKRLISKKATKRLKKVVKVAAIVAGAVYLGPIALKALKPVLGKVIGAVAGKKMAGGTPKSQAFSEAISEIAQVAAETAVAEAPAPPEPTPVYARPPTPTYARPPVEEGVAPEGEVSPEGRPREAKAGLPKWAIPVGIGATILIVGVMLLKKK